MFQLPRPGIGAKKGAQPADDGFFHCRLCDKRFEKVKSLNAHMKSHAMKARAEAEAQTQQQHQQPNPHQQNSQNQQNPPTVTPNRSLNYGNVAMSRTLEQQKADLLGPMPTISNPPSGTSKKIFFRIF